MEEKVSLEQSFLRCMQTPDSHWSIRLLVGISWLLSVPYQCAVSIRNYLFDAGWLSSYQPPVPVVISIGNIVVGGTGKTPTAYLMSKEFCREIPTALASRGYRSPAGRLSSPLQLSRGEGPVHPASYCGDEPFLLSKRIPELLVFVGKDRKKASNMAARAGAHLMILDDGLQHRQLARDFDVIVVDGNDPVGGGHFLPRGRLRESVTALSRANIILVNGGDFLEAKALLEKYSSAPIVACKLEVSRIVDKEGAEIDAISGKKVGIFCGIAKPKNFESTVRELGAEMIAKQYLPDHIAPTEEQLRAFAQECKERGAEMLLCTEKDFVKVSAFNDLPLPLYCVEVELKVTEGVECWEQWLSNVKSLISTRI